MPDDQGRCISCDFLAQRAQDRVGPMRAHYEVEPAVRINLYQAIHISEAVQRRNFKAELVCYRRVAIFPQERVFHDILRADPAGARQALAADRECAEWCQYQPALDPKEHLMDRRVSSLEEDRKLFQKALDDGTKRLVIAIGVASIAAALIIGFAQLTSESTATKLAIAGYYWLFPSKAPKLIPPVSSGDWD